MKKWYRYDNGKRILHTHTECRMQMQIHSPRPRSTEYEQFVSLSKIELSLTKGSLSPKYRYRYIKEASPDPELVCYARYIQYARLVAGFYMFCVLDIKRRKEGGVIVGVEHGARACQGRLQPTLMCS